MCVTQNAIYVKNIFSKQYTENPSLTYFHNSMTDFHTVTYNNYWTVYTKHLVNTYQNWRYNKFNLTYISLHALLIDISSLFTSVLIIFPSWASLLTLEALLPWNITSTFDTLLPNTISLVLEALDIILKSAEYCSHTINISFSDLKVELRSTTSSAYWPLIATTFWIPIAVYTLEPYPDEWTSGVLIRNDCNVTHAQFMVEKARHGHVQLTAAWYCIQCRQNWIYCLKLIMCKRGLIVHEIVCCGTILWLVRLMECLTACVLSVNFDCPRKLHSLRDLSNNVGSLFVHGSVA